MHAGECWGAVWKEEVSACMDAGVMGVWGGVRVLNMHASADLAATMLQPEHVLSLLHY